MTVSGQPTTNYFYDDANRLTQITQGLSTVAFTYDDAGRRTSLTLPNGVVVEYTYDKASRLTELKYKNGAVDLGNLTYFYDKAGNRTRVGGSFARTGLPQAVASATYDNANRQTIFGGKTMVFDTNGNLTSITDTSGTTLHTWNARNQLTTISGPGVSASFVYDGLGRREKKTINGSLTEFLYDGINPVQETAGAAVLANMFTGLAADEFFTRSDSSGTQNLLQDALGSVLALTDSTGVVQSESTYEPFGNIAGTASSTPFQYTGRENDGTGLYYYRARYYNPQLQRFVSEDPLGFTAGVNFYAYVRNSPANATDPFGLRDNASPWQVGWEWLSGTGPRAHYFTDGDPFTEVLRGHQHIQNLIGNVCKGNVGPEGRFDYKLSGLQGIPKYANDYSTLATGGLTGNLAVTYLGSYNLQYSVTNATLNISVWNVSSIASATRPPVIGYTDWWANNVGRPLNDFFSSGAMSPTEQYFTFQESLSGRGCTCK